MRPIDADKIIENFDKIIKNLDDQMGGKYLNHEGMRYFMNRLKEYINRQPTIDISYWENESI